MRGFLEFHEVLRSFNLVVKDLVGIVGEAGELVGSVLDMFLAQGDHLEFVWVDKALVLFELLIKGLQVYVEMGLTQAEELVVVDMFEAVRVFKILARVAGQLLV
jgi:hypothetical protein